MKNHEHIITGIVPGSIADELGVGAGDRLLSINGQEIEDIFDYQFYSEDEELLLLIESSGNWRSRRTRTSRSGWSLTPA